MKLIIGGAFQGKKAFAEKLRTGQIAAASGAGSDPLTAPVAPEIGSVEAADHAAADGAVCEFDEIFRVPVLYHFHDYIRRCLEEERDFSNLTEELMERNPQIILVTNELGYGVVPIDKFDRRYRESHGRICCKIAAAAEQVWRVYCGIGDRIK